MTKRFWNALYPSTSSYTDRLRSAVASASVVVIATGSGSWRYRSIVASESNSPVSSISSSAGKVGGYIDGVEGAGEYAYEICCL